jgi:hypothetical protein
LRLRLACSAATLGHLASEGKTGLRVRNQRSEAALARVAVSDVALEVVDWFGSARHGFGSYHI